MNATESPPTYSNGNTTRHCVDDGDEWHTTHHYVVVVWSFLLIFVGTLGNVMTIAVFNDTGYYKKNVMADMLRYLAVLDILSLWTIITQTFIKDLGYGFARTSTSFCLVSVYWSWALSSLDNWVLVIITITRFIYLKWPYRAQTLCSKFNYYLVVLFSHIAIFGAHAAMMASIVKRMPLLNHKVEPVGEYETHSKNACYIKVGKVQTTVHRLIYAVINFIAPFIMLIGVNIMIANILRAMELRRERLFAHLARSSVYKLEPSVATSVMTRDQSKNALGSESTIDDHNTTRTDREERRSRRATQPGHHSVPCEGDGTAHKTLANGGDDEEMLTSHLSDITSDEKKWRPFLQKTEHLHGEAMYILANEKSTRHFSASIETASTAESVSTERVINIWEIQSLPDNAPSSRRSNDHKDTNWNNSFVDSDPPEPRPTRPSTLRFDLEIPPRILDSALESNTSSMSTTRSSVKASSVATWLSEAMSHPVDMGDDELEDPETKSNDQPSEKSGGATYETMVCVRKSGGQRVNSLTLMLMMASVVFVVCNLPFWIFHLFIFRRLTNDPTMGCHFINLMADGVFLLRYTNHSINFILYCAVGSRFRQDFCGLLRRCVCYC